MTFSQAKQYIYNQLIDLYTESEIHFIAQLLVEKISGNTYLEMLMYPHRIFDNDTLLYTYISALKHYVPLQYVLGESYFCGYRFKVNEHTLIPRPETEMLVTKITQLNQENTYTHVLDIGTGSGCIAISAKIQNPHLQVDALDISLDALVVAKENAHTLNQAIHFIHADIFQYDIVPNQYDMIVSNPPYVSEADKSTMQPQVVNFEPHRALFVPDSNMLLYYTRIVEYALTGLKNNAYLVVEIEKTMGKKVFDLIASYFSEVTLYQDFNGNDRMIVGKKK